MPELQEDGGPGEGDEEEGGEAGQVRRVGQASQHSGLMKRILELILLSVQLEPGEGL